MNRAWIAHSRGLVGAILGGALGFYTFRWLYDQNFYGLVVPGAFLGLGCGLLAGKPSTARGIACGLAGIVLAIYTEWRFWPFENDTSFLYFCTHISQLKPVTLLMTGIGGAMAYWLGKDSGPLRLKPSPPATPTAAEPRSSD